MCENAHGATTRAQSLEAPAAGPQILRACAVEMHMDDVERHECTVNSNELAGHARALQRSKHTCFATTVKTPSLSTLFGENIRVCFEMCLVVKLFCGHLLYLKWAVCNPCALHPKPCKIKTCEADP